MIILSFFQRFPIVFTSSGTFNLPLSTPVADNIIQVRIAKQIRTNRHWMHLSVYKALLK